MKSVEYRQDAALHADSPPTNYCTYSTVALVGQVLATAGGRGEQHHELLIACSVLRVAFRHLGGVATAGKDLRNGKRSIREDGYVNLLTVVSFSDHGKESLLGALRNLHARLPSRAVSFRNVGTIL